MPALLELLMGCFLQCALLLAYSQAMIGLMFVKITLILHPWPYSHKTPQSDHMIGEQGRSCVIQWDRVEIRLFIYLLYVTFCQKT